MSTLCDRVLVPTFTELDWTGIAGIARNLVFRANEKAVSINRKLGLQVQSNQPPDAERNTAHD
jgi:hypothetical protein